MKLGFLIVFLFVHWTNNIQYAESIPGPKRELKKGYKTPSYMIVPSQFYCTENKSYCEARPAVISTDKPTNLSDLVKTEPGAFQILKVTDKTRLVKIFWQPEEGNFELKIFQQEENAGKNASKTITSSMDLGFIKLNIGLGPYRFVFRPLDVGKKARSSELIVPAQNKILSCKHMNVSLKYRKEDNGSTHIHQLTWDKHKSLKNVLNYSIFWLNKNLVQGSSGVMTMMTVPATQLSLTIHSEYTVGLMTLGISVNTKTSSSGLYLPAIEYLPKNEKLIPKIKLKPVKPSTVVINFNKQAPKQSKPIPDKNPILTQLLNAANKEWTFSHGQDLVLLLGRTRSGKSSLGLALSDQDSKRLYVNSDGKGGFRIIDESEKTSSSSQSHTLYPEQFKNAKSSAEPIYCDIPGFYDTRGPEYITFNDMMLKKVLDGAKGVKLLFVASKNDIDREESVKNHFIELLQKIASLVVNLDKYKNSMALVIKRFEPAISVAKGQEYVRTTLTKLKTTEKNLDSKVRNVLDVFIATGRHGIWKEPNRVGAHEIVPSIVENKKEIRKLLSGLKFVSTEAKDFNYD